MSRGCESRILAFHCMMRRFLAGLGHPAELAAPFHSYMLRCTNLPAAHVFVRAADFIIECSENVRTCGRFHHRVLFRECSDRRCQWR